MKMLNLLKGLGWTERPECPLCDAGLPIQKYVQIPQPDGRVVSIKKEVYDRIVTLNEVVERQWMIRHAQRKFRRLRGRMNSLNAFTRRNAAWDRLSLKL